MDARNGICSLLWRVRPFAFFAAGLCVRYECDVAALAKYRPYTCGRYVGIFIAISIVQYQSSTARNIKFDCEHFRLRFIYSFDRQIKIALTVIFIAIYSIFILIRIENALSPEAKKRNDTLNAFN